MALGKLALGKWLWENFMQKNETGLFYHTQEINSKWIKDLNLNLKSCRTVKVPQENREGKLLDFWIDTKNKGNKSKNKQVRPRQVKNERRQQ